MTNEETRSIQQKIASKDAQLSDQQAVAKAIKTLCCSWVENLKGVSMAGVEGAPDWKGYETRIWQLGEQLRHFLTVKRGWRGSCEVLDSVAWVLADRSFGKGRQAFALLLGYFGGKSYCHHLADGIDDPEVCGHSIKALTKAKCEGYAAPVERVAARESGWIRSAAKQYLKRFGGFRGSDEGANGTEKKT